MQEIINSIYKDPATWLLLLILLTVTIYMTNRVVMTYINKAKRNRIIKEILVNTELPSPAIFNDAEKNQIIETKTSFRNAFCRSLYKAIKLDLVDSLGTIVQIYKGIFQNADDTSYKTNLSNLLREFLILLLENDEAKFGDSQAPLSIDMKIWEQKIIGFINENDRSVPFSHLPENERSLLIDLTSYNDKADKESIFRKIEELSILLGMKNSLISENNENVRRLEKISKWSVPTAVIGIILTIIFGVVSIILTVSKIG